MRTGYMIKVLDNPQWVWHCATIQKTTKSRAITNGLEENLLKSTQGKRTNLPIQNKEKEEKRRKKMKKEEGKKE